VPVSLAVRLIVFRRAADRCEYCRIREWWLEVDHIIPEARWEELGGGPGLHALANLAAACIACNNAKRDHVTGVDEVTATIQLLFNPRTQAWSDHFAWSDDFEWVVGFTPIGRATVGRLQMNRPIYRRQRRTLRSAMIAGLDPWP
jgi:hypothetical protein